MKNGLLLINLGTPDKPDKASVRDYLAQFLTDKRVIDLPFLLRHFLVKGLILPFRPKKTAHGYQSIWTSQGSPLLVNSVNLQNKLQDRLGDRVKVILGMRYGNPSLAEALQSLQSVDSLIVLPLYPQFSSSASGSAMEAVFRLLMEKAQLPNLIFIRDFYKQNAFIQAQANRIRPFLAHHEFLLFSYHGLPVRHLKAQGCKQLCQNKCVNFNDNDQFCYKAQCYKTTDLLANTLKLQEGFYETAFQSRLGKTPWITPYTDELLVSLANRGIKKLAIACPSFVTDCLETLEEIGIRAKNQWLSLGGTQLTLIPSLNEDDLWVSELSNWITHLTHSGE